MGWKVDNLSSNCRIELDELESSRKEEPKMLKEYLSEAVSLLAEVVLGKPQKAHAGCVAYAASGCQACGAEKRWWNVWCNGVFRGTICDYC